MRSGLPGETLGNSRKKKIYAVCKAAANSESSRGLDFMKKYKREAEGMEVAGIAGRKLQTSELEDLNSSRQKETG